MMASPVFGRQDDGGDFFDLDFSSSSSSSVRASSSSSGTLSLCDSDHECRDLDFIISLQRSSSASPLKFRASEPPTGTNMLQSPEYCTHKRGIGSLRTLSFGAKAAPLYGCRSSFARSSSGRRTRSLRLFMKSPALVKEDDEHHATEQACRRAPSRDVIRRCLAKISRRLRTAASPRAVEARGLRRLRKCRSASSSTSRPSSVTACGDDSVTEKQESIASAIAHCKESIHRASTSECDSPLLRSGCGPGKCEAA